MSALHYRDTACNSNFCRVDREAGCHEGAKDAVTTRLRCASIRGVLYTLTHAVGALIAIQTLDGVANAIFGIVSILVVKDRTQGTGRSNVACWMPRDDGWLSWGGLEYNNRWRIDPGILGTGRLFLGLSGIALLAFGVLWFAIPETLSRTSATPTSVPNLIQHRRRKLSPNDIHLNRTPRA